MGSAGMHHNLDAEEQAWQAEIESIESWWRTKDQEAIKRPYTAAEVASLRSSLPISYPANVQAQKLRRLLRAHHSAGTAEMTFGMIDPILASQMAHQSTIYVSGALCAFGASECMGQDMSDYPWDTVPKAVERIFKSQLYHDRRQRNLRMKMTADERAAAGPPQDHLIPIVADGDMGFGTTTATMKLVKALVEAGTAMFHIDDNALGGKRYTGPSSGHTIVSTDEYLHRLTAARLQLDVMGAETMIMCRCDADGAQYITSNQDPRDHGNIIGATVPTEPLSIALQKGMTVQQWKKQAAAMTFDDAFREVASSEQLARYESLLAQSTEISSQPTPRSITQRRAAAKEALADEIEVFFDWDSARMPDGRYLYHSTLQAVLDRTLAAAPLGEVTWARTNPRWAAISGFHEAFRKVHPDRLFAAGYGGTYNFAANGYSAEDVRDLHLKMARLGIVWQMQPAFAMQALNKVTRDFSKLWAEEGMGGYVREVQGPAMKVNADGYEKMEWSGGYLADAYLDILHR